MPPSGAALLTVLSIPLLASGCGGGYYTASRAGQGPDYARQVFSLYDGPGGANGAAAGGAARAEAMKFPANAAVAEVGELAPPPALLEQLRKERALFRRVEGIPGIADGDSLTSPFNVRDYPVSSADLGGNGRADAVQAAAAMQRLLRFAREMGMDYLMLFGATVDSDAHVTELSVLDLTIIGAYVVPSRRIAGRARASAVLVDLRTNRVVLSAGTEAGTTRFASDVAEAGSQDALVKKLRDDAFGDLGNKLVASCKARTGLLPEAASAGRGGKDRPAVDPFAASASAKAAGAAPVLSGGGEDAFKPLPPDPVPGEKR